VGLLEIRAKDLTNRVSLHRGKRGKPERPVFYSLKENKKRASQKREKSGGKKHLENDGAPGRKKELS